MSCTSTGRIDQTPELRQGPKVQWCHFQLVKKSKGKTYYDDIKFSVLCLKNALTLERQRKEKQNA